jgi:hypothetical protein
MPRESYTRTGTEVADDVKRIFGDEALVELKNSDLLRWINAAQREIATSNQSLKGSATSDIVAGQTLYALPGNSPVYQIQGIHYKGVPLRAITFQAAQETINADDPEMQATGDPKIWYEWDGDIYIYPSANEDGAGALTLYYIAYPQNLTSLSDTLQVPDRFYNQVMDYVLGQAYRLDENWQAMSYQDQRFRDSMNRHMTQENIVDVNFYPTKNVLPEDE